MEKTDAEIKDQIKDYILENFLFGAKSDEIGYDTSLIENKLIDSISTLQLVEYLEQNFKVEFKAHEVNKDNLDTIDTILNFIHNKTKEQ